ncbi:MAG: molybdenum cofactor biosynthesis protein MoaB [Thermoplasmata archaeon]|nr:MAG: molybdenum cofactor biosynthesis protein MoaB [Thermoplasmata archaeon]
MGAEEHKKQKVENLGFAIVTVSDSKTVETDSSGALIKELVEKAGHRVVSYDIVKDDKNEIYSETYRVLGGTEVSVVILCGGTGISHRDVTVETIKPMLHKELTGFGEIFRVLSMKEIGSAAIMSRATAGVIDGKAVFCIPGSIGAVKLAMEKLILEECGHIIWEANR